MATKAQLQSIASALSKYQASKSTPISTPKSSSSSSSSLSASQKASAQAALDKISQSSLSDSQKATALKAVASTISSPSISRNLIGNLPTTIVTPTLRPELLSTSSSSLSAAQKADLQKALDKINQSSLPASEKAKLLQGIATVVSKSRTLPEEPEEIEELEEMEEMEEMYETGNPELDEILKVLKRQLEEITKRGQMVNPNIELTPERVAEFMAQAEREINPYYQTQLKLAREGFLSSLGYTKEEVGKFEQDLTKKFRSEFRSLGESAAERGFTLSGLRRRDESELATQTQRQAEDVRSRAAFQAEQQARQLGSEWGKEAITPLSFSEMPQFTATGEVLKGTRELPMFNLGSTYDDLIGSREFERRGAVKSRKSELEEAERTRLYNQELRKLSL